MESKWRFPVSMKNEHANRRITHPPIRSIDRFFSSLFATYTNDIKLQIKYI